MSYIYEFIVRAQCIDYILLVFEVLEKGVFSPVDLAGAHQYLVVLENPVTMLIYRNIGRTVLSPAVDLLVIRSSNDIGAPPAGLGYRVDLEK